MHRFHLIKQEKSLKEINQFPSFSVQFYQCVFLHKQIKVKVLYDWSYFHICVNIKKNP